MNSLDTLYFMTKYTKIKYKISREIFHFWACYSNTFIHRISRRTYFMQQKCKIH